MMSEQIKLLARRELVLEGFRAQVEAEKARLRATKWWHRFVPFTITITITRRK